MLVRNVENIVPKLQKHYTGKISWHERYSTNQYHTDCEDSQILRAELGESVHKGDYEMLHSSETKVTASHPTIIVGSMDLWKLSWKSVAR